MDLSVVLSKLKILELGVLGLFLCINFFGLSANLTERLAGLSLILTNFDMVVDTCGFGAAGESRG